MKRDVSPWFAVGILLASLLIASAVLYTPAPEEDDGGWDKIKHIREGL